MMAIVLAGAGCTLALYTCLEVLSHKIDKITRQNELFEKSKEQPQ